MKQKFILFPPLLLKSPEPLVILVYSRSSGQAPKPPHPDALVHKPECLQLGPNFGNLQGLQPAGLRK